MTIHHIADYMTQSARHDAFMRRHPVPCDIEQGDPAYPMLGNHRLKEDPPIVTTPETGRE